MLEIPFCFGWLNHGVSNDASTTVILFRRSFQSYVYFGRIALYVITCWVDSNRKQLFGSTKFTRDLNNMSKTRECPINFHFLSMMHHRRHFDVAWYANNKSTNFIPSWVSQYARFRQHSLWIINKKAYREWFCGIALDFVL